MTKEEVKKDSAASTDDSWDQESSSTLFKFETVGQKLTGLVTNYKSNKTRLGEGHFWTVLTAKGEETFIPTKALHEDLAKFQRQYGLGKFLVDVEFVEEKKGNYPNPFKVFKVRAGLATESRLAAHGIKTYDSENTINEDDLPPM